MEEVNKEEGRYQNVLAFDDYMNLFEKNPEKELRPHEHLFKRYV